MGLRTRRGLALAASLAFADQRMYARRVFDARGIVEAVPRVPPRARRQA